MLTKTEKRLYLYLALLILILSLIKLIQPPLARLTVKKDHTVQEKVSLNAASKKQLESVKGIGPVLAGRIISRRRTLNGFRSWEDVLSVQGIGDNTLKVLKLGLRLEETSAGSVKNSSRMDEIKEKKR